ncbi:hypothetical protein OEZ85_014375 [Tetradesmus obliquus]|uniref:Uncharacterized protein n=1 Tax=Tetradesmus obliquus TaxID=3088 RepID=A0ABY8U7V6_TETOB|nr:hypothetical protein OEZ85_014375 [Tetradesmus obliquus]
MADLAASQSHAAAQQGSLASYKPAPRLLFGFSLAAFSQHARAAHAAGSSSNSAGQQQQQQALTLTSGPGGNSSSWGGGDGSSWGSGTPQNPGPQPLALLAAANKEPLVLTVASFAVTKLAYVRLTKLFREKYLQEQGVDVRFRLTFAGSGVQARAVIDGLPADMVALALPLDVQKIADAGLLSANWQKGFPLGSVVCETTVALVVRPGNPKNIQSWEDLTQPGLQVIVANPKTAGVARWIFLALWGSKMKKGAAAAKEYITKVFDNVLVQPRDAREASDVFYRQRLGDVLLTYENEVVLTNQVYGPEKALPYVVPSPNVRIECPMALVDKVLDARPAAAREAAHAFGKFCFTPEAQVEFGRVGFRINRKLCKTPPAHLAGQPQIKMWTVDKELGGWGSAQRRFFDAGEILDQIQADVGARKAEARKAGKK